MIMSDFNEYAKRLDKAFDDAATEQREALQAYDTAAALAKDAVTPAEKAEAKEGVKKAKARLDDVQKKTWPEFRKTREQIGKELQKAVDKAEAANPDEVDNNAVNLLYSDMLTRTDLAEMADRYKGNKTMLRMIGNKAEAMAENEQNDNNRRELKMLSRQCKKPEKNPTMEQWNNLCGMSQHYSGELHDHVDPGYIAAVNTRWRDANVQSAIDDF